MKCSRPGTIDDLFQTLRNTLKETLQQSGFGVFSITSQRSVSYTRQLVFLCDSTQYSFAFTDKEILAWQDRVSQKAFIHLPTGATSDQPEQVLRCLEQRLLRTWGETGCGCLEVKCERSGRNMTRVIIGGAPSYCFHIHDSDVTQWMGRREAIAHQ